MKGSYIQYIVGISLGDLVGPGNYYHVSIAAHSLISGRPAYNKASSKSSRGEP